MSDKPISKGDLVMVVRPTPCCGRLGESYGRFFTVGWLETSPFRCAQCGTVSVDLWAAGDECGWVNVSRLKRLDPDTLMDDVPTGEELTV